MAFWELAAAWLCGIGAGTLIGWLLGVRRRDGAAAPESALEAELRRGVAAGDEALKRVRAEAVEARAAQASAEASRAAAQSLAEDRGRAAEAAEAAARADREHAVRVQAELESARKEIARLGDQAERDQIAHAVRLREVAERQEAALAELRAAGERQLEALRVQFKALAGEALNANNPEFLRLAQEKLAQFQLAAQGDLDLRAQGVAALVQPLQEALRAYQARLQQAEAQQQAALGEVRQQLERLRTDNQALTGATQRLREVLNSNQARGRWGEETLRRVVESAGLSPHCDFTEQVRDGDAKPDMVVRLPGGRVILVDAKVPDLEFLASLGEADEGRRGDALRRHAQSLRLRVTELSQRNYPGRFPNALDYAVLFVPAESLFSAALEGDPELLVWASEKRVLLATPASLVAILRSVAVSWQQYGQSRNADEIAREAAELLRRLQVFGGHFEKLRRGIASAAEAFNEALGSYDGRVRPAAERLAQLGVRSEKELPEPEPILIPLRPGPG